jgi:hypothetical protein
VNALRSVVWSNDVDPKELSTIMSGKHREGVRNSDGDPTVLANRSLSAPGYIVMSSFKSPA